MVITRARIDGDFDQFWDTFRTKGSELRAEFGSRGARAYRDEDDPREIWVVLDMDRADFERFLQDPRLPEIMKQAGLAAPPEPFYVEPIGETAG